MYQAHNMEKMLWISFVFFFSALAVSAATPGTFEITEADLAAAGVPGAAAVAPTKERFLAPVKYFRTKEKLSESDAKKDCSDCGNLVAVYAAPVPTAPNWTSEPQQRFLKIGGRLQLRAYLPATKRIVIVTGPNEGDIRKISSYLSAKFSQ